MRVLVSECACSPVCRAHSASITPYTCFFLGASPNIHILPMHPIQQILLAYTHTHAGITLTRNPTVVTFSASHVNAAGQHGLSLSVLSVQQTRDCVWCCTTTSGTFGNGVWNTTCFSTEGTDDGPMTIVFVCVMVNC